MKILITSDFVVSQSYNAENNILLQRTIDKVCGRSLYLPNSVSVVNGEIIICDGGNNRVCIIKHSAEKCIGNFGLGKYKFKEPVYCTKYDNCIFVCDWHNHRIVSYKDDSFDWQVGVFGTKTDSMPKIILKLLRSLSSSGSFIEKHFGVEAGSQAKRSGFNLASNFFKGLLYYITCQKILWSNIKNRIFINKPNGCVLLGDNLIFTQKNSKCISVYNLISKTLVSEINNTKDTIEFGRLGQIAAYNKKIYACDETKNKVHVFKESLEFIETLSLTSYNIFSIAINSSYIVTCGETSYSIFDHSYKLLYEVCGDGEYHGVALDDGNLYICNRLHSKIEIYSLPDL